jgi:steroid 5-alpha reductase family enzyme
VASFQAAPFWHAVALVALVLLAILAATFVIGRVVGKHSVIDTAWGLLFCGAGGTAFLASVGHGNPARRVLLLVLVLVWGLRLAGHIARRSIGKPEDPRYEKLLAGKSAGYALLLVYGLQGLLAFLVAMPVVVGSFSAGPITALAWLGVLSWLVGVCFEAVGDWQLERYKADPNRGQVMDRGLWRYTRHPNYFGDACVWIGIFLVAAERWPGVLTVFSPVIMVYLLAFGSGKRVLERSMSERAGYPDYMRRTSGFVPLPPRKS